MSAKWEVQKSIYNALATNSTFMTLISNRLYDEPETNQQYPYVTLGEATEVIDNTHDKLGYNITLTCAIYTKPYGLGYYQGDSIYAEMNNSLNMKKLTMSTGYRMIICKLDYMYNEVELREQRTDGEKRVHYVRYRVLVTTT